VLAEAMSRAATERPAFLDQACAGDGALRAEVESLLGGLESAESFLQRPTRPGAADSLAGSLGLEEGLLRHR